MKVSGRKNAKGKPAPERRTRGGDTMTPSDDKPSRVPPRVERESSESAKLESRKKLPANRTKVQPVGSTRKPRKKAA